MHPNSKWLTIQETADHLKVSKDTVRRWISRGEISARKIGRLIRIEAASLEQLGDPVAWRGGDA